MNKEMKNQILMLIIGILIGAIITTGVFLIIKSNDNNKMPSIDKNGNFEERIVPNNNNKNDDNNIGNEN